jgi:hypothetical protein
MMRIIHDNPEIEKALNDNNEKIIDEMIIKAQALAKEYIKMVNEGNSRQANQIEGQYLALDEMANEINSTYWCVKFPAFDRELLYNFSFDNNKFFKFKEFEKEVIGEWV